MPERSHVPEMAAVLALGLLFALMGYAVGRDLARGECCRSRGGQWIARPGSAERMCATITEVPRAR